MIHSIRTQGLAGLVAKRREGGYEPVQRSGGWRKIRINRGHEFVIAATRQACTLLSEIVPGRGAVSMYSPLRVPPQRCDPITIRGLAP
ncbi:MAG TPA: hypothetical protein VH302_11265 [Bryobacteraceae bacterium]|nr:hypothetical protein [Bryobacteraceae bacterium]